MLAAFSVFQLDNERWFVSLGPSAGAGCKIDVKEFASQADAEAFAAACRAQQAAEQRLVPVYTLAMKLEGNVWGVNLRDFIAGDQNIPVKTFASEEEARAFVRECSQPQPDEDVHRTHVATFLST